MEQGVHVLCEKPLAISTEEAIRMADTAERCQVVFSMGSKFRFVADVQKAREIIDSGILGDIILYENTFAGFCDMSKRWNSQPAISGGGVLIDNGTHSVDILRYLLGNITELQVVEGRRIQNLPVEDTALLFARTGRVEHRPARQPPRRLPRRRRHVLQNAPARLRGAEIPPHRRRHQHPRPVLRHCETVV